MSRAEADQVLRIRQKAAARPLVTVVLVLHVQERAVFTPPVKACSMRDDGVDVIRGSVAEIQRLKDLALHVGEELGLGCTLDDRAHEVPAIARVRIARAGLEEQRIILENGERFRHAGKMRRSAEHTLKVSSVVANAGCMARQLSCGDRPWLLGEPWNVPLDGDVEIEAAFL